MKHLHAPRSPRSHPHHLGKHVGITGVTILALIGVSACTNLPTHTSTGPKQVNTPVGSLTGTQAPAAGGVSLIQEPDAGYSWVTSMIDGAHNTVSLTMYELTDPNIIHALEQAKTRGVNVRIILDKAYTAGQINTPTMNELTSAGVQTRWGPPGVIVHQKTLCVDTSCAIGTGNMTPKYYSTTWDAWILTTSPSTVAATTATFDTDWDAMPTTLGNTVTVPTLVFSPSAGPTFASFISSATRSVEFSSEELSDPRIIKALETDAKKGVTCDIVMTASTQWNTVFRQVSDAGCKVRTYPDSKNVLYIHEKQIIVDGKDVLMGSQNASATSLNRNRELSVHVTDPSVVHIISSEFTNVFNGGTLWS